MFKKFLAALFCVALIFAVGCDNEVVYDDSSNYEQEDNSSNNTVVVNPLTGIADVDAATAAKRPVAIMINNISVAQPVQTGLSKADIIYETEVEGGITRLLAVFKDISKLDKIGTVRSARYPYIDLALGHDAVYVHFAYNKKFQPLTDHFNDVDRIDLGTNSSVYDRVSNGLASEHTAYALAKDLDKLIAEKFDMKASDTTPWVNFAAENETVTLDGGSATSVSVPFPAKPSVFNYDEESGLYNRIIGSSVQTDYFTQEPTQVKNVFVLLADIYTYNNTKYRMVDFEGGDGYYITNGTVQFIKWSKGKDTDSFKFTDTEGNEIKVSAGNSWVCIANKTSNITIE